MYFTQSSAIMPIPSVGEMLVVAAVGVVLFADVKKIRGNLTRNIPQLKKMFNEGKGAADAALKSQKPGPTTKPPTKPGAGSKDAK